ncbi:CCR4-NOT transcription complex subunit 6 [Toxocara canis]|uniref:poly(A)-specific ribonuclease n=1 Tax=Toxocara canis TaxID=6265 RepID=A0A0B2VMZ5_TOXCA|nr:CCR4-NOT transcription complex subunit 6 [Toxocara canis]
MATDDPAILVNQRRFMASEGGKNVSRAKVIISSNVAREMNYGEQQLSMVSLRNVTDAHREIVQPNGMRSTDCATDNEEQVMHSKLPHSCQLQVSGGVSNISPQLWQMTSLTTLLMARNELTSLPSEVSKLTNLTFLDLSFNCLQSVPPEMGDMSSLCHLFLNDNQLQVLPYELGKLRRLQTFQLDDNPLTAELKDIYYQPDGQRKLLDFLFDKLSDIDATSVKIPTPPTRQWIMTTYMDPEIPAAPFTILSYNVLCEEYTTSELYSYCPQWALKWQYRKEVILREIREYQADIILLQEVETEQFWTLFQPELRMVGYAGIFSPKARAYTVNEDASKHVDGCAIFWKEDKFEKDRTYQIGFPQLAMQNACGSIDMLNRVVPKDNIALCAVLRIKKGIYPQTRSVLLSRNIDSASTESSGSLSEASRPESFGALSLSSSTISRLAVSSDCSIATLTSASRGRYEGLSRQITAEEIAETWSEMLAESENFVGRPLILCTTHIHWNPKNCDVKLVQSMLLAQEVGKILAETSGRYHITKAQTPVILCGDFNSLPDSGVYEFFSKGAVAKDHPDLKQFRDADCLTHLNAVGEVADHKFYASGLHLKSAFDITDTHRMHFTNYTEKFSGMIDHMFFTPQSLLRLGLLGPLDDAWIRDNNIFGFPHPHIPSDHIPIMAQFALISNNYHKLLRPGGCEEKFSGMIDHMFFTPQSLLRLGLLGPLDDAWIRDNNIFGFPHPHIPSDHIPIMAQFALISNNYHKLLRPGGCELVPWRVASVKRCGFSQSSVTNGVPVQLQNLPFLQNSTNRLAKSSTRVNGPQQTLAFGYPAVSSAILRLLRALALSVGRRNSMVFGLPELTE